MTLLTKFLLESNKIEGIDWVTEQEESVAQDLLNQSGIKVEDVEEYVKVTATAVLRSRPGMRVFVGNHVPMDGGPLLVSLFEDLLNSINKSGDIPYNHHVTYETLHPFTDGNGRSGRLLWLWQHIHSDTYMNLGFLHQFYYETLQYSRKDK